VAVRAGGCAILRYRSDIRTVSFVSLYFVLLAGVWVWTPVVWWHAVPAFAALCVLAFMGAVTTHNSLHCPPFKYRWMNKVWQVVLTLTYGHPVSSYVPGHNLSHHKYTQSRKDVMRTSKARFRWNVLNLLFFVALISPSIMRADSMYVKRTRHKNPRWFKQLLLEMSAFWAAQIALFVIDWRKAIIFWLLPHLYAQWGIVTMNLLQHDGTDEKTEYDHSRNFVGGFVNWWTYNNGYHTIHHLKPSLHWSLTPAAHAELVAPHIHPALDQKSLFSYLWTTYLLNNRVMYDGREFVLPDEGPDEDWIPDPSTTKSDLGAESMDSATGGLSAMVTETPDAPAHSV